MNLNKIILVLILAILPFIFMQRVDVKHVLVRQTEQERLDKILKNSVEDGLVALAESVDYVRGHALSTNTRRDAINSFFTTLSLNFDIENMPNNSELIQRYVPAVVLLDLDGYYVYSTWDKFSDQSYSKDYRYVESPKRPYAVKLDDTNGSLVMLANFYLDDTIELIAIEGLSVKVLKESMDAVVELANINSVSDIDDGFSRSGTDTFPTIPRGGNSTELLEWYSRIRSAPILSDREALINLKQQVIVDTITKDLKYYAYQHNQIATQYGIKYDFTLSYGTEANQLGTINSVGLMSFLQGVPIGTEYYNSYAFEASKISDDKYYYCTNNGLRKEYHLKDCEKLNSIPTAEMFRTKEEAAGAGYYPCSDCKP